MTNFEKLKAVEISKVKPFEFLSLEDILEFVDWLQREVDE